MKNLLSLLILFFTLTLATVSYAQTFGVQAGLNLSKMYLEIEDDILNEDVKVNPGFHLGASVEFPINNSFSFQTGLLLSTKGFRVNQEDALQGQTFELDGEINLYYFDIPLMARGSFDVGNAEIYGLFGPYVGYGFSGRSKSELTFMGQTETDEEAIEWGNDEEDDFQSFDFGLTAGVGVEINSFLIGFSYDLGIMNIIPSAVMDVVEATAKHRVMRVSVGYKFGGK